MPDLTITQFIAAALGILVVLMVLCYFTIWLEPQDQVEQPEIDRGEGDRT